MNSSSKTVTPVLHSEIVRDHSTLGTDTNYRALTRILLAIGIALRLYHFLDNRSLWLDEIYLATSLVRMDFLELTRPPLDYEQKAPIGFLWMCRIAVLLFGSNEMALRLVPLLSGIAALFTFVPVSRHFLKPVGAVIAIAILALAPPIIYHAVEVKQYSTELLATVLVIFLYIRYYGNYTIKSLVGWGIGGAIIIWFSFSSIFVLAGMAMGLCLFQLLRKDWKGFFLLCIPSTMWLLSFGISYLFFVSKQTESEWLVQWFANRDAFITFPPTSLRDVLLPLRVAGTKLMDYPLGLVWNLYLGMPVLTYLIERPILPVLCWVIGLYFYFKKDRKILYLLLLPLLLAAVASTVKLYPLYERMMVFLAPLLILAIAHGCEKLMHLFKGSLRTMKYVVPVLLLAAPLYGSAVDLINPQLFGGAKNAGYREFFRYIDQRYRAGDEVYVYWNIRVPYLYYKDASDLKYEAIIGNDFRKQAESTPEYFHKLTPELKALDGKKRVWVIYSKTHVIDIGDFDGKPVWYVEEVIGGQKLHKELKKYGNELQSKEDNEIKVSLFDFSK